MSEVSRTQNQQPSIDQLNRVWDEASCLHDEAKVNVTISALALSITEQYQEKNPVFIGLMKGAMVFLGRLTTQLPFPLQIDACNVSRYGGEVQASELHWHQFPSVDVKNRHVIFVDDIFDEGKTLLACCEWAQAQGCKSVASAVLVEKLHDRKVSDFRPDYVGLEVPDVFVVGYGMDYKDYFRNANGIFAIQP